MLYEIKNAKKYDGEIPIKWYSDKFFDLCVWFSKGNSIISFQLTYDKIFNPHAITWKEEKGFLHEKIDDGEVAGKHKKTPILMADGEFPKNKIIEKFKAESLEIDSNVSNFVYDKLLTC